ncbi:MAG: metal ABC transporter solute-binding protein, Zn/Mn family [Phycisphaerae bacterium]
MLRDTGLIAIAALIALGLGGCDSRPDPDAGKPTVVVSIPPQGFLVRRIAGDAVGLHVLVGPDEDPHHYEPTQREMVRVSKAKVYFTTGVDFEEALVGKLRDLSPDLRIVDTTRGLDLLPMEEHDEHADHGDHDDHNHHDQAGQMDPHVWLSPLNAKKQASLIADHLSKMMPARSVRFQENLRKLHADLEALHQDIQEALRPLKGRTLYVFHPAFGYFAHEYGLEQVAVEAAGKAPGPRRVQQLIDRAKADNIKVIFVHPQFSDAGARAIAREIGGAVVALDPLAGDYLSNLRRIARAVSKGLGESP